MHKNDLKDILLTKGESELQSLYKRAYDLKCKNLGIKLHLRGLIELSNICVKNCYYCGIRHDNRSLARYELTYDQVLESALFAHKSNYGSVVLQGGERTDDRFRLKVAKLVKKIKEISNGELGITLSLGEQPADVYREWYNSGAHRYLLRIESSSQEIYYRIHPQDSNHSFEKRVEAIDNLMKIGYQTGTGVMIGLPYQTVDNLVDDLLFFKSKNIHMVGMGPYLVHSKTPLGNVKLDTDFGDARKIDMPLKMISALRLLMPNINIAATTALQVLDPYGRELGIKAGANIIMPNMTIPTVRSKYTIYENKPGVNDDAEITKSKLERNLNDMGLEIGWKEWGDSLAFKTKE